MDTGIGAARHREHGSRAKDLGHRRTEVPTDGADTCVLREAAEGRSVVCNLQAVPLVTFRRRSDALIDTVGGCLGIPIPGTRGVAQTSSSFAMGALSPVRGPSFRMRV